MRVEAGPPVCRRCQPHVPPDVGRGVAAMPVGDPGDPHPVGDIGRGGEQAGDPAADRWPPRRPRRVGPADPARPQRVARWSSTVRRSASVAAAEPVPGRRRSCRRRGRPAGPPSRRSGHCGSWNSTRCCCPGRRSPAVANASRSMRPPLPRGERAERADREGLARSARGRSTRSPPRSRRPARADRRRRSAARRAAGVAVGHDPGPVGVREQRVVVLGQQPNGRRVGVVGQEAARHVDAGCGRVRP